ncbi:MAG: hypothetical protein ACYDCP_11000 [Thermoplasmataceae archaeon]
MTIKSKIRITYLIIGIIIAIISVITGYIIVNKINTKWQAMERNYNNLHNSYRHYLKKQREFNEIPLKKVYATNKTILMDLKHGDIKYAIINLKAEQWAIKRELGA